MLAALLVHVSYLLQTLQFNPGTMTSKHSFNIFIYPFLSEYEGESFLNFLGTLT